MNKNEFDKKIEKYYSLNEQIKKMNKVKSKLNNELKEEIKGREEHEFEIVGHRVALNKKKKISPKNDKIKKMLIKEGKKIKDYYNETEYYTLTVMKIKRVLKMESINE